MDTAVASHTAPLAPTAVYTGETGHRIFWWALLDSNQRPRNYEFPALTI
jgi:hypothetical protein